ncbi:MAG TPA: DUF4142 domain-containing protein [Cyclobacteriaceae bacterium]|jgi:putative membrane protein|nr:DUF4142 domain-containing protein [Cyclobacteriaceae bacterium]
MKKVNRALLQSAFIVMTLFLTSSCRNNKQEDTKEVAEDHNDAKFDKKNERDAQFLVNAAEINLQEIRLGRLAEQNGKTQRVKDLAKMMVDAHTKSQEDLSALASKKTITLPTSATDNGNEAYKKLGDKSANDFDETYSDMMVRDHKDAINLFEKASTDCSDADIKGWATSSIPTLRRHLDHAMVCQKAIAKK